MGGIIMESKQNDILRNIRGYKQEGPTCGIYALLNGVFGYRKCNAQCIRSVAKKLWKVATKNADENVNKIGKKIDSTSIGSYSLVGEFFDSKNLYSFIKKNSEIIPGYSLEVERILSIPQEEAEKPKSNEFYLVPINSSCKRNKNNMHWICLKKVKNKLAIINSTGNKTICFAKKNAGLRPFNDNCSIDTINKLIHNIQHRNCEEPFDFHKWALKYKWKICVKWPKYPFISNGGL